MPYQEHDMLRSIKKIDAMIDMALENIDEPEKQNNVNVCRNLNLKVETLEKEILALRKEKKIMKDKMERMDKIHKHDKQKMKKCLAKSKFELACVEKKLEEVIFTKGQIRKLKNGVKRQIWSEDDVANSITIYSVSPKMYRFLYRKQFPLPAVRTPQSWTQKSQDIK